MVKFEIAVVGSPGCGKTSFIHNVGKIGFDRQYRSTRHPEVYFTQIKTIKDDIEVALWDYPGKVTVFPNSLNAIIIMFDCSSRTSFLHAVSLKKKIFMNMKNPRVIMIANKMDLLEKQVSKKEMNRESVNYMIYYLSNRFNNFTHLIIGVVSITDVGRYSILMFFLMFLIFFVIIIRSIEI